MGKVKIVYVTAAPRGRRGKNQPAGGGKGGQVTPGKAAVVLAAVVVMAAAGKAGTHANPGGGAPHAAAGVSSGNTTTADIRYVSAGPATAAQQAFISAVAPGAVAGQKRYGVPAAVTIAQAINESSWGQSSSAAGDHNLFGVKGTGPAGTDVLPTKEFEGGRWVTVNAGFRVYHTIGESITDHEQLLAFSPAYRRAMADRASPDRFANDLTGVYATSPAYGADLIKLMHLYHLYQF